MQRPSRCPLRTTTAWCALVALAVVAVGGSRSSSSNALSSVPEVRCGLGSRVARRRVLAMIALLANQAMFHAAAQRAARLPTGPFGAVRPALAATFMNQVTKSGGMAGLTMLVADGDRRRLGRGPVVAAYAARRSAHRARVPPERSPLRC